MKFLSANYLRNCYLHSKDAVRLKLHVHRVVKFREWWLTDVGESALNKNKEIKTKTYFNSHSVVSIYSGNGLSSPP